MKFSVFLSIMLLFTLVIYSCTNESESVAVMGVEFEWQPIDYASSDNPEIILTGVPAGTERLLVSLVDLDVRMYDHGSGFVDYDGSGLIARGIIKGTYSGPAPRSSNMIHDYEITVKAYDEKDTVIGIGKNVKKFTYGKVK
jgi:hypothetical protein